MYLQQPEGEGMGGGHKKFAVLLCAEDSDYVRKIYGGYFGVFTGMLKEEGEIWDAFAATKGDLPSDEEIHGYDGFVITGSCSDAFGNDLWIRRLLILLRKLIGMRKKVLGICFGHQILARAIGGRVGRAVGGWDVGTTEVHLYPSRIFASMNMPSSLNIFEIHHDEVLELPPRAEVLAWSEQTGVEMFRYGNHIMGIQGHPEYTQDILLNLINRLSNGVLFEESFADEAKARVEAKAPDRELWRKLCTNFLKGRLS